MTEQDHRGQWVLLAGSGTTVLALGGVFLAAHHGENIMGWYANYIIPAGALLVGIVAASGYGVVAWLTGLKMTRKLVWTVAGELAVSYFIAQYGEYQQLFDGGSLGGFFTWFDRTTRGFAWKDSSGHLASPLGVLGYGLRALELAGFLAGGALVPLALKAKPYCDPCRTYKRTSIVAQFVAGDLQSDVAALFAAAAAGDAAACAARCGKPSRFTPKGVHARVSLVRCPRCADGALVAQRVTRRGNQYTFSAMGSLPLPPDKVKALFDGT